MTSPDDEELIAQLRRSLGSEPRAESTAPGHRTDTDDPPSQTERVDRIVSPAAMAIADQIMGLEEAFAGRQSQPRLVSVRAASGHALAIDRECTIGRQEGERRLIVLDGRVSRSHALITNDTDGLRVRDLGSSNGTFRRRAGDCEVVGRDAVELRVGDRLETIDGLLLAEIIEVGP